MTRKKIRVEKIECRVSKNLKKDVQEIANKEGMTITGWIEMLIRNALKKT